MSSVSADQRFAFDVQGYLHLQGALSQDEVCEYLSWIEAMTQIDIEPFKTDDPESRLHQMNQPVSRIFDVDIRFACFLDHPAVAPYLVECLGPDYRHIDNDLLFSYPDYEGGQWHRGVREHPTGHVVDSQFICPMIKVFYCVTDVEPDEGAFAVNPGSHKAQFPVEHQIEQANRVDMPGQHIFDTVKAGDIVLFNEALIHTGRPNPSSKIRKTIIVNFGRKDTGVWETYQPRAQTLQNVSPRRREILSNRDHTWDEPVLT